MPDKAGKTTEEAVEEFQKKYGVHIRGHLTSEQIAEFADSRVIEELEQWEVFIQDWTLSKGVIAAKIRERILELERIAELRRKA